MTFTDWPQIRTALREEVAIGLGWHEALVNWESEPDQVDQAFARLTIVSDVEQGERTREVTQDPLKAWTIQDFRAQIQVQIEDQDSDSAMDHARSLRTHFQHRSTRELLAARGIAIVQECGAARDGSYFSDGFATSVAFFEIPIRYQTRTEDKRARLKEATSVEIAGEAAGVAVSIQVDKP